MAITYTPTTNFGAKDSLPTNDPDKVIKGSEFTTEFTALQTAFSLAAPNASPTFTGTVTIPTADINGGNIDGTVIGAVTPAAASFTTVSATGNITVGGTVDGRDVAADGTKLDGIEAGADVTDTTNVTAAGALMDSELTNIAAVKALNQGVATTDSPSFAGLTATGSVSLAGASTTADITFGDNDKAIFGAGSDLQIYHDGLNSYIDDTATGFLNLRGDSRVQIGSVISGETMAEFIADGAVNLYHNNALKLATTATGIDVTGTVTADGLTVNSGGTSSNMTIRNSGTSFLSVYSDTNGVTILDVDANNTGSAPRFQIDVGDTQAFRITEGGDISFYEDTGTTASLVWDSSQTQLKITGRETSRGGGVYAFDVDNSAHSSNLASAGAMRVKGYYGDSFIVNGLGDVSFFDDSGSAKFFWDASAESLGIGTTTTAISSKLQVASTTTALDSGGTIFASTTDSPAADIGGQVMMGGYYTGTSVAAFGGMAAKKSNATDGNYDGYLQFLTSTHPTGNTEKMRIDASGNVGIGTTSPAEKLHVSGVGRFARTTDATQYLNLTLETGNAVYNAAGSINHVWQNAGTEQMRLDTSGNLGLGVTPGDWNANNKSIIQLQNTANLFTRSTGLFATSNFVYNSADTGVFQANGYGIMYQQNQTAGTHVWLNTANNTSGAGATASLISAMTLDANNQLLLGTTSTTPITGFSGGSVGLTVQSGLPTIALVDSDDTANYLSWLANSGGVLYLYNYHSTSPIIFGTNNTETMRLDASGNLLVGTTNSSGTSGSGVKIANPTSPADDGKIMVVGASSTAAQDGYQLYSTGASAYRFFVTYGGAIYATSTSITAISDESLKENIRDLDKGLDTILALKPRRFDWKNGDGNDIMGFVAQEVQEALPELVHDYKYNDSETKLGIKMGDMLPSLVKAIQEQQEIINDLRARVAQLEGA